MSTYDSIPNELRGIERSLSLPVVDDDDVSRHVSRQYDAAPAPLPSKEVAGSGDPSSSLYDVHQIADSHYSSVPAELYGGQSYDLDNEDEWQQSMMPDGTVYWKNRRTGETSHSKRSMMSSSASSRSPSAQSSTPPLSGAESSGASSERRSSQHSPSARRRRAVTDLDSSLPEPTDEKRKSASSAERSGTLRSLGSQGHLSEGDSMQRNRVLLELIASEKKNVSLLNTLVKYYVLPLRGKKKLVQERDASALFGNVVSLLSAAESLLRRLQESFYCSSANAVLRRLVAVEQSDTLSNTLIVCNIFAEYKSTLTELYAEYAKTTARQTELMRVYMRKESFVSWTKHQCALHSFTSTLALEDLLVQPVLRATQYTVFFRDLLRFSDGPGVADALASVGLKSPRRRGEGGDSEGSSPGLSGSGKKSALRQQAMLRHDSAPVIKASSPVTARALRAVDSTTALRHAQSARARLDTGADQRELSVLVEMAETMESLARSVNTLYETAGNAANSTASIEARLDGYPLGRLALPGRRVLVSEQLRVSLGSKRASDRMCFLFHDMIMWCKKGRANKLHFDALIPLQHAIMSASGAKLSKDSFQLFDRTRPDRLFRFKCASAFSRKKWTVALAQRIDSYLETSSGSAPAKSDMEQISEQAEIEIDEMQRISDRLDSISPLVESLRDTLEQMGRCREQLKKDLKSLHEEMQRRSKSGSISSKRAPATAASAATAATASGRARLPTKMADLSKDPLLSRFYHPTFSRNDCQVHLKKQPEGAFVLRNSSKTECVACSYYDTEGKLYHSLIHLVPSKGYCFKISDDECFPTINELLKEHGIGEGFI